jgi:hypothetical protein
MTDTTTLAALESRIAKLERRNRLLTTSLAAALAIGVFTAAKTASQPGSFSEVKANKLILLDDRGREVGTWGTDAGGYPYFELRRSPYSNFLKLVDRENGPYLVIRNTNGGKTSLDAHSNGSSLSLQGPPGTASGISLSANSNPSISTTHPNRAKVTISPGVGFPLTSYKTGGNQNDWQFTDGSLWLNGMGIRLNNANGDPIQVLPQHPLPQTTKAPKNRFPLFGPRRP